MSILKKIKKLFTDTDNNDNRHNRHADMHVSRISAEQAEQKQFVRSPKFFDINVIHNINDNEDAELRINNGHNNV